jgi:ABC-type Na+ efflux pump permease subunit
MKIFDIAIRDLVRAFRSAFALVFMFGVPLLVTGMFYFMFGNLARDDGFNLPRTKVIVANLDAGGPKFQTSTKNIPGSANAHTMGELVVSILQSDDLAALIAVTLTPTAEAARAAVDSQAAQVAIIIPADFSKKFADPDAQATIEFYQDPTLTIGPGIIRSILNRFMDGMAGVKIAVNIFVDEASPQDYILVNQIVRQYLDTSLAEKEDVADALIDFRASNAQSKNDNPLLRMITPIMGGMMVFYAFFTGASTAQNILKEEEERTLPRLFTTPTPQSTILGGKFLAVFLTVLAQVVTLMIAARVIFQIEWGALEFVAPVAAGIVFIASSFGICINSFMKDTKQSGVLFGGVLTLTGMLGMISIFALNSPSAALLSETVSLLVPQGWAIRGLMQMMSGNSALDILLTVLAMFVWSGAFFAIGVWRFNQRYA